MGKITLSMMVTLDGYVADPNNELDWVTWEEAMDHDATKLMESVDAMLVGYGAYKDMVSYWPAALTKANSEGERVFAEHINEKPKIILSQTEEELLWKNEELVVVTDLVKQISELREQKGNLVLYGGVGIAQAFVENGLIDEYHLFVSPVAIGSGKPLFNNLKQPLALHKTEAKVYESGALLLRYQTKNLEA
ncbi:MAG TPA: dihydrofolate reductase family protein [Verrucomicrobiae bacterium]|nr:dihydrofolate reductase family protein [Verrucomicrobiae bacterium]